MPHIDPDNKQHYAEALNYMMNHLSMRDYDPGHLTYLLYSIVKRTARSKGTAARYADLSRIRASLHDASDEFYRLIMAPYEDAAIERNGEA